MNSLVEKVTNHTSRSHALIFMMIYRCSLAIRISGIFAVNCDGCD